MITSIVTEENELIRHGLKDALEETNAAEVIGDYSYADDMMPELSRLQPDVVILGGIGSLDERCRACNKIQDLSPGTRILTLFEKQQDNELHQIIMAGATGCVLTSAGKAQIVRSVGIVANGGLSFDRDTIIRLVARGREQLFDDEPAALDELTERERIIMALVAQDYSNEEIGQKLNLSKFTVRNNIVEIRSKLNVNSRLQLATFAVRYGLLDEPGIISGNEDASA